MKKFVTSSLFFVTVFAAQAANAGWYCAAASWSAHGWGTANYQATARQRALSECSVRTPRNQICYVTTCHVLRGETDEKSGEVESLSGKDALDGIDLDSFAEEDKAAGQLAEKM